MKRLVCFKYIAALGLLIVSSLIISSVIRSVSNVTQKPPTIKVAPVESVKNSVTVRSSDGWVRHDVSSPIKADAGKKVEFSAEPTPVSKNPNSIIMSWKQQGLNGVELEVRTKGDSGWTQWTPATDDSTGKDGANSGVISTLVLAKKIDMIQYRFTLRGGQESTSAVVDPSTIAMKSIDSTDGPTNKQSELSKLKALLPFGQTALAFEGTPRIISREEWGCPQANWSEWTPEYKDLGRAIVHHTATTESTDSYASVRAIWQYHTYSNGWGDIGYNYLVDSAGNIFQGRLFDQNYAKKNRVDVIGGHALSNNSGTTGISAIGNFTVSKPTRAQLDSIARITAYKLAPYSVDPAGSAGYGPAVIGHYEVNQTSCPGANMISQLSSIKSAASGLYRLYNQEYRYDYSYVGQKVFVNGSEAPSDTIIKSTDTVELEVLLKNEGSETWSNTASRVVLGTTGAGSIQGKMYDPSSWAAPNRLSSFQKKLSVSTGLYEPATTIARGETASFRTKVKVAELTSLSSADSKELYSESFRPVIDGQLWFPRDLGMFQTFIVEKKYYDYNYTSHAIYNDDKLSTSAPQSLLPNTDYYLMLSLRNTGTTTWDKTLRLGTSNALDRSSTLSNSSWLSSNRPAAISQDTVMPGQNGTFIVKIHTPDTVNGLSLKEYFRPVVDGKFWLRDSGIYFPLAISRSYYDWTYVSQGMYTDASRTTPVVSALQPGQKYYATLTAKNAGTLSWQTRDLKLGTASPLDRKSVYYDSSWLSQNRPAANTDEVKPGDTATIGFWVDKKDSVSRKEYFRPVIDGKVWLNDVGLYWNF